MSTAAPSEEAVFLVSYGGPTTGEEVGPFLRAILSDPEVTGPAASLGGLLARLRGGKARRIYREMGGGSPGTFQTSEQARLLEEELARRGRILPVFPACLYHRPSPRRAVEQARSRGLARGIVLPAFPQRSGATAGAAMAAFRRAAAGMKLREARVAVPPADFARALEAEVRAAWEAEPARRTYVHLFTAHSLPLSRVRRGDRYPSAVHALARLLVESLRPAAWSLAWQSRVGPVRWLGPDLREETARWLRRRCRGVMVIPLSFGCEGSETLWELDVDLRRRVEAAGAGWCRIPVPWNHPGWIGALAAAAEGGEE